MRLGRLWMATLLPPLAWGADFACKLFLQRTVNATQNRLPLHLLTAVALGLVGLGFGLSHRLWRQANELLASAPPDERGTVAAARSVTRWGMALAVFFGLLVAAMALPTLVFHPRDLP